MACARLPNLSVLGVVAALLCAPSAAFAFKVAYTVGGDGSCDFSDIQAAVAAATANPPHNMSSIAASTMVGRLPLRPVTAQNRCEI